jgi:L-alanine-DL-glutamate epimerase-like enolase superfamily enzyme
MSPVTRLKLTVALEKWPLAHPFRIAGHVFDVVELLIVTLESEGYVGRGEAAGVFFKSEKPESMRAELERLRPRVESGVNRGQLASLLPAGGARNALDCALWDLEAQLTGQPVWQLAAMPAPHRLLTTFTCGADTPAAMAVAARGYVAARAIKMKLMGDADDAERILRVRESRPDVWLGVDGNQSFSCAHLEHLLPIMREATVALIEQPFRVGREADLDGFGSPIPIAADESALSREDLEQLRGRFGVVNIKLDKCGGLTEGLAMAELAKQLGMRTMVGCMPGTSLAMAPAFLLGQRCELVDLDAPLFLREDRKDAVRYEDGYISCPSGVWGSRVD